MHPARRIPGEAARSSGLEDCLRARAAAGPEDSEEVNGLATYEAYCVKCKAKREFEGQETTLKNGRRAAKGKCPVCGTTVMRILGKAS